MRELLGRIPDTKEEWSLLYSDALIRTETKAAKMVRAEEVSDAPFKFSSIPPPLITLNVKNASSLYARTDNQSLFGAQRRRPDVEYDALEASRRQQLAEDVLQESASEGQVGADQGSNGAAVPKASTSRGPTAKQELDVATANEPGSRTIVVQFGSSSLKIGLASQPQPASVPFVVARPSSQAASFPPDHSDLIDPNLDSKIDTMRVELRARMRSNKVREWLPSIYYCGIVEVDTEIFTN